MNFGGYCICVAAGLSILRIDDRIHDSGWAPLLGRLGAGRSQQHIDLRHWHADRTVGIYPCQHVLHGSERHQSACLAAACGCRNSECVHHVRCSQHLRQLLRLTRRSIGSRRITIHRQSTERRSGIQYRARTEPLLPPNTCGCFRSR